MSKSRSEPVLMQHRDEELAQTELVLRAWGVWAVCYDGEPIALCVEKTGRAWRYPKTCFTQVGFARRLAERLNALFATSGFGVMAIR